MPRMKSSSHKQPPISTRWILTVLLSLSLSVLVAASPAPSLNEVTLPKEFTRGSHGAEGHTHAHEDDVNEDQYDENDKDIDMDMDINTSSTTTSVASIHALTSTSSAISKTTKTPPDPHLGHNHGSHAAVKLILDDVDIHKWHSFPPSYLAADFKLTNDSAIFGEEFDSTWDPETAGGHPGLMVVHVSGMIVAYFGALPLALGLRAADHPSHYLANAAFLIIALCGWLAGVAYKAQTPDRYEGAVHNRFGNILLLLSIALATLDSLGLIKRSVAFFRRSDRSWSTFVSNVLFSPKEEDHWVAASRYEMVGLTEHDEEEHENHHDQHEQHDEQQTRHQGQHVVFVVGEDGDDEAAQIHESNQQQKVSTKPIRPWLLRHDSPPSRSSTGSDGTLHDTPTSTSSSSSRNWLGRHKPSGGAGAFDAVQNEEHDERRPAWRNDDELTSVSRSRGWKRAVELFLTWVRRTQVVIAYVVFLTGVSSYTGMCRAGYINTCAAHLIKGSIFFFYGVFTFGRYLGAYADLGWAWNRRPDGRQGISAEMVECGLIFTYGITNTWMERFGAEPGSPYTVKEVQHISIAVMFWFAGLMGMCLESKRVRRILAAVTTANSNVDAIEPPSYAFSFNPLPPLVIAVTGLAMAAHHQDYEFQVQIHSLWGILLAGASLFRCFTYFFLWLRPPTDSVMPSRPPTEVLASFGMSAGGIVFMLSTEEITYAAMRAGYDDMMAFLNVTIALNSLIFCWVLVILAVKGMGVLRVQKRSWRLHNGGERIDGDVGRV